MPHLIIEYARELEMPVPATLHALHQTLLDSGLFEEVDIKIRAQAYADYLVGGAAENRFVHLNVLVMDGRSEAVKKQLANALCKTVKQHLGDVQHTQITAEVRDMLQATYAKIR